MSYLTAKNWCFNSSKQLLRRLVFVSVGLLRPKKTELVRLLKIYSNGKKIGAVGDGGNDVGMMNEADLAISIAKTSSVTAAALASEISITSFGHLDQCILGYG